MASNFFKIKFEPRAKRLTFHVHSDSAECKINEIAWKTDLLNACRFKPNQQTPKRPDSGHPLPVQSIATVQTLDALIPSRATQAYSNGRFVKRSGKIQLHS